jgi:hypothetical protein
MVPQIKPQSLPSKSFPTCYSLIIPTFDAIYSELIVLLIDHKLENKITSNIQNKELPCLSVAHEWQTDT